MDSSDSAAEATAAVQNDLEQIIAQLDAAGKKLPEQAIRDARQRRDEIVPRLIETIRIAAEQTRAGNPPEGQAHFFALFLLTEFRVKQALPVILEAICLPDDLREKLFGDAVYHLERVLAVLADDQTEVMESLLSNRELSDNVRWGAATAYCYLVRDGRMDREDAVQRLRQHLRAAIDHQEYGLAGPLVQTLSCLYPVEALEEIREAYQQDLVDTFLIGWEEVEEEIERGEQGMRVGFARQNPTAIDTLEELRGWASFQEGPPGAGRALPPALATELAPLAGREPPPTPANAVGPKTPRALPPVAAAVESPTPRIGRNEPCPCGSGKKFKKCCGRPGV